MTVPRQLWLQRRQVTLYLILNPARLADKRVSATEHGTGPSTVPAKGASKQWRRDYAVKLGCLECT